MLARRNNHADRELERTIMASKMLNKIVRGAAVLLFVSDARLLADGKQSVAAEDNIKIWTAQDLSTMAKTKTMEAAVSFLTSDVQATGAPVLKLDA